MTLKNFNLKVQVKELSYKPNGLEPIILVPKNGCGSFYKGFYYESNDRYEYFSENLNEENKIVYERCSVDKPEEFVWFDFPEEIKSYAKSLSK